jgi:RNA polymerase-binding protein DksA
MRSTSEIREKLEARLEALEVGLQEIDSILREPEDSDSEERAAETEADRVLELLGRANREEIRLVRRALERITNGSYGKCERCGGTIATRRLSALPFTTLCIRCADSAAIRRVA